MKINLLVRMLNPAWWATIVPAFLLAAQAFLAIFGYTFDFTVFGENIMTFINAIFAVLAVAGVVIDPTTEGINDSARAMTYCEPKSKESGY